MDRIVQLSFRAVGALAFIAGVVLIVLGLSPFIIDYGHLGPDFPDYGEILSRFFHFLIEVFIRSATTGIGLLSAGLGYVVVFNDPEKPRKKGGRRFERTY